MELFDKTSLHCSKIITKAYSTSFTLGIQALDKKFRMPIYGIYGFVRYADEIVDTFHDYDKKDLLEKFRRDTHEAIASKISLNPVLHSFQLVVNEYRIETMLIDAFLDSMEMDLYHYDYDDLNYKKYIYGSAEVVGLMCLKVFCEGDDHLYLSLKEPARALGSAFQKVNFLRDIKSDFKDRKRVYFPNVNFTRFNKSEKTEIEKSIQEDFDNAFAGIKRLPESSRMGVYLAYVYYTTLFSKIKKVSSERIMDERIRVSDNKKLALFVETFFRSVFNNLKSA